MLNLKLERNCKTCGECELEYEDSKCDQCRPGLEGSKWIPNKTFLLGRAKGFEEVIALLETKIEVLYAKKANMIFSENIELFEDLIRTSETTLKQVKSMAKQ